MYFIFCLLILASSRLCIFAASLRPVTSQKWEVTPKTGQVWTVPRHLKLGVFKRFHQQISVNKKGGMTRSSNILFCQLEKIQADLHINYILGVALLWPYQKDTFDQERGLVFFLADIAGKGYFTGFSWFYDQAAKEWPISLA